MSAFARGRNGLLLERVHERVRLRERLLQRLLGALGPRPVSRVTLKAGPEASSDTAWTLQLV